MIKEALQYLIGLASGERPVIDGRQYSTTTLHPVMAPTAEFLELHSLTGLVDYLRSGSDISCRVPDGTVIKEESKIFIHVLGPGTVYLYGALDSVWHQRECFLKVSLIDNSFRFGQWHEIEDFIVEVQSKFEVDETVKIILGALSKIDDEAKKTLEDNGVSQKVMIRTGITTLAWGDIPNPIILKPYRTFAEVEQPSCKFVLRLRSATQRETDQGKPKVALFDAGGNLWQMEAIQAIKNWLHEQLPDIAIMA